MKEYRYKTTALIVKSLEEYRIHFNEFGFYGTDIIEVEFPIRCGPVARITTIIADDDSSVAVRVFNLISKIPEDKKSRVLEVCNLLNKDCRFIKFCLEQDGDISAGYDFPVKSSDKIGAMLVEIIKRTMRILDMGYRDLITALYTEEELAAAFAEESDAAENDEPEA